MKWTAGPHVLPFFFQGYVIPDHLDDVNALFYFVGSQFTDGHGLDEVNKGKDSWGKL